MPSHPPHNRIGFLLSQLGAHATMRFAQRLSAEDLAPPHIGLLFNVRTTPGLSQQTLAERLGLLPSKVVTFVDELEQRELIERTRSSRDRRVYELGLTPSGEELMDRVSELVKQHDEELGEPLDADEREQLLELLGRIADHCGLSPGIHPGYRKMR